MGDRSNSLIGYSKRNGHPLIKRKKKNILDTRFESFLSLLVVSPVSVSDET